MARGLDRFDADKLQAIQDSMSLMPPTTLRSFMSSWEEAAAGDDPEATESFLDEWYRRARFAAAQHARPVNPEIDPAEWLEFPGDVMSEP
ncbi:MAG: hypothetical protein ACRDGK_00485 [Actinomycetota bacterium]